MEVYFDNSATTRCYGEVKDIVVKTMLEDYGNPSAMHTKGVEAEQYVKAAASRIARILKVYFSKLTRRNWDSDPGSLASLYSKAHMSPPLTPPSSSFCSQMTE